MKILYLTYETLDPDFDYSYYIKKCDEYNVDIDFMYFPSKNYNEFDFKSKNGSDLLNNKFGYKIINKIELHDIILVNISDFRFCLPEPNITFLLGYIKALGKNVYAIMNNNLSYRRRMLKHVNIFDSSYDDNYDRLGYYIEGYGYKLPVVISEIIGDDYFVDFSSFLKFVANKSPNFNKDNISNEENSNSSLEDILKDFENL